MKKIKKSIHNHDSIHNQGSITLYHFTSLPHLGKILTEGGLSKGDVPITVTTGYNAVWFTVKPSVSEAERMGMLTSNVDKSQVRITVEFPIPTPKLYEWDKIASQIGIARDMRRALDKTGGHGSKYWWIYAGKVPTEQFKDIEFRHDSSSPYFSILSDTAILDVLKEEFGQAEQFLGVEVETGLKHTVLPFPEL